MFNSKDSRGIQKLGSNKRSFRDTDTNVKDFLIKSGLENVHNIQGGEAVRLCISQVGKMSVPRSSP